MTRSDNKLGIAEVMRLISRLKCNSRVGWDIQALSFPFMVIMGAIHSRNFSSKMQELPLPSIFSVSEEAA